MRTAYLLFVFLLVGLGFLFCNEDNPVKPPEEVPCDTVFVEVKVPAGRVEGVWEIDYIQDPSPNNYGLIQNDVSVFAIITPSAVYEEIRVEVSGNFKQGDILEMVQSGSKAGIRVAFRESE